MIPSVINWVEERSKCNTELLFNVLAEQVKLDVDSISALKTLNVGWGFVRHNGQIIVTRSVDGCHDSSIVFTLSKEAIVVEEVDTGNRTTLFQAIPYFLGDRTCKLEINDVPVETWQVSRRALERLFFEV